MTVTLEFALGPVGKVKTHEHLQVVFWHLYFSTKQLQNGDSAAVTFTLMFMASPISKNSALANSPQLSHKNSMGGSKNWIQLLNITLMIMLGSLDGMDVDGDNQIAYLIRCRRISSL